MPRFPMPKIVRLAGRRVRLVIEKSATLNLDVRGLHQGWKCKITLDEDLAPDEMKAVAVHEIVHDLEELVGIGMSEKDVTAFSSVLFGAIRDNPDLMKWLMS